MRLLRTFAVAGCILALNAAAWGQAPAAKSKAASAPAVPAKAILEVVPAGSMGFAVVSNARQSLAAVDDYLNQIGVGPVLQQFMPGDLLSNLQRGAQLGEGFNPDGGFAAVMLDPQAYGIDIDKLIAGEAGPSPKLPFLLLVPGSGIQDVFGSYPIDANAAPAMVKLRMGEMYAVAMDGYVVLSPVAKALDAVKAEKKASSELSKDQIETIGKSEFAVFVNMKVAGPLVLKGMDKAMAEMKGEPNQEMPPQAVVAAEVFAIVRNIVGQVDSGMLAAHFTKTAMIMEAQATFKPESPLGKAMAAVKPVDQSTLLDRVPNFKYVFAAGGVEAGKAGAQAGLDLADAIFKVMPNVPAETREKMKTIAAALAEQVTQKQFVVGGAPEGSGALAVGCVLQCADADKLKPMLADYANCLAVMIKSAAGDAGEADANAVEFKAVLTKDADKLDALSVDAIDITSPKLAAMEESDRKEMKALLGDDKIRVLMAVPQPGTLVLTLGGGKAFLAEAVKTAKGGGTIPKEPDVVDVFKVMPKQTTGIVLFNVGNLFDLMAAAQTAMGKTDGMPPFKITAKTPLAIGCGASGTTGQLTLYVPNKLIHEVVQMGMQMFGMMMGGGAPGGEGEEVAPAPAK